MHKWDSVDATVRQQLVIDLLARIKAAQYDGVTVSEDSALGRYCINPGPPLLVAFGWPNPGWSEPWYAYVCDPIGHLAAWPTCSDAERESMAKLFGGVMYHARRFGSDWYICYFCPPGRQPVSR